MTIYDEVPGGTVPETVREVPNDFFVALQLVSFRSAREQDGERRCYRCILRQAALDVTKIGRKARRALSALVKSWERQKLDNRSIERSTTAEAGQLERMPRPARAREKSSSSSKGRSSAGTRRMLRPLGGYEILPQKELKKEKDGVAEDSRVDFWIRPLRADASTPPVAVFTDGFEFHGSPTSDGKQLQTDVKQRGAIVRASKPMRVWSLTYKDVERADGSAGSFWSSPFGERTDGVLPERLKYLESRAPVCARRGAFDALLRCLDEPEPEKEPRLDVAAAIALYAAPDRTYSLLAEEDAVAFWDAINDGLNVDTPSGSSASSSALDRPRRRLLRFRKEDPRQVRVLYVRAGRSEPAGERRGPEVGKDSADRALRRREPAWSDSAAGSRIPRRVEFVARRVQYFPVFARRLPDDSAPRCARASACRLNDACEERAEGEFTGDEDWLAAENFAQYELLVDASRGWRRRDALRTPRRRERLSARADAFGESLWDEDTKNVSRRSNWLDPARTERRRH